MAAPIAVAIWTWLAAAIPPLIINILVAMGVGFITYSGADLAIDAVGTYVQNQMSGLPGYMLQLIGKLQMDTAISMILAAYAARFAVQAVNGALSRVSFGNSGNSVGV